MAIQYGRDYWDGERQYEYGGYSYDGRWRPVYEGRDLHGKLLSRIGAGFLRQNQDLLE